LLKVLAKRERERDGGGYQVPTQGVRNRRRTDMAYRRRKKGDVKVRDDRHANKKEDGAHG